MVPSTHYLKKAIKDKMDGPITVSLHNLCNTDCINFRILVQCECNQSQVWKLTRCFSVLQGLCKLLYSNIHYIVIVIVLLFL